MRAELLPYLWCPDCHADLHIEHAVTSGKTIVKGDVVCGKCAVRFPITEGVPDFVGSHGTDVEQTTEGFAGNWDAYNHVILSNELLNRELFSDWIWPLRTTHFEDKVVVEAGCGMGRWLRLAAEHRPGILIGFDYSSIVRTAARNVSHLERVHVIQADIFRLPIRPVADIQYSIGVVHHTPDPAKAFACLSQILAKDGVISCWVYGAENNEWITRFVDPIRRQVTSELPQAPLNFLSHAAALVLRGGAATYTLLGAPEWLPYRDYIVHLKRYPFDYMTHIIYDHLVPKIAHYISREEVSRWVNENRLFHVVSARNANSWRILGGRTAAAVDRAIAPTTSNDAGVVPPSA